jgi:hypothetical protein
MLVVGLGTAVVVGALWVTTPSAVGQTPTTYKAPRTPDGQPDISGIWQAFNGANWNVEEHGVRASGLEQVVGTYLVQPAGLGIVEGGKLPYKPEALARRDKNWETRLTYDPLFADPSEDTGDPEAKCYQGGIPRANYLGMAFQILQSPKIVLMAYEFAGTPRMVHLDPAKAKSPMFYGQDTWMGQSLARWEGETLVVDVKGFSGTTWLDRAGNFISPAATVVERYTRISRDHMRYEATVTDPDTFTRPWKLSVILYRRIEPNAQLLEFQCIPFAEEFMYSTLKKKTAGAQ